MRSVRFPRRFLLCLLLLPLATPSFAQVAAQLLASDGNLYGVSGANFYSYSPTTGQETILNANGPAYGMTLCLERSDGTLLAIGSEASGTWQALDVTLAGVITAITQFPSTVTSAPGCPAPANDGNYYGSSSYNGDYNYGFIYQLTSAEKINIFYNFTGGPDGRGPSFPPVQASDGNLYWYNSELLLRYSPTTGLTPITIAYSGGGYPLLEASDGNFYAPGGGGVLQLTPKGATTIIYTPPTEDEGAESGSVDKLYLTGSASQPLAALTEWDYSNEDQDDYCYASGNYFAMQGLSLSGASGSELFGIGYDEYGDYGYGGYGTLADYYYFSTLLFGGNGNFYTYYTDDEYIDESDSYGDCEGYDNGYTYNTTYAAPSAAPITMSLSQTHVKPGGSAALTWSINNAYSDTLQQCYGYGSGLTGKVALTGSATVSAPSAGTYVSSIVCGGTETGIATLTAGNATLSLSGTTQVNQGSPVTLTATVTNAGTPAATGKVNFLLGQTVVGTATLANNVATLTASTATVPPGTYNIVASYVGDSNYGPATSSSVTVTVVGKSPTSTTLTPTSQSVLQGASISITATVVGNSTHGSPTGTVKFMTGSTVLATETLSYESSTTAEATLTASTTSVPAGTYPVSASYSGDSGNLPSTSNGSSVTVTIKPTTPVTLAIAPNPVPADTSFMLTATINGKDSPSGTVFFYENGTTVLTSGNVSNGVATVTVPAGTLASGTYQMTATYAGDANNPTGTSPAVSLTVQ